MKSFSILALLMFSGAAFADGLTLYFPEHQATSIKGFLQANSDTIIKEAAQNKINITEEDIANAECLSGKWGACTISGDQFAPNSDSKWLVNVTQPEAGSCDYQRTKVSFVFLTGEC